MIEVELKKESCLENSRTCLCGRPATRIVLVGEIQNSYGTDYDLCAMEACLNDAMDNFIEDMQYTRYHRNELMAAEHFDLREGK